MTTVDLDGVLLKVCKKYISIFETMLDKPVGKRVCWMREARKTRMTKGLKTITGF